MPAVDLWLIDVSDAAAADEALLDPAERARGGARLAGAARTLRPPPHRPAPRARRAHRRGSGARAHPARLRALRRPGARAATARGRGPGVLRELGRRPRRRGRDRRGGGRRRRRPPRRADRILAGELPRDLLSTAETDALAAAADRAAFLRRLWVRKEALGKLQGTGLGVRPAALDTLGRGPLLADVAPAPGYRGALAVSGGAPAVTVRFG